MSSPRKFRVWDGEEMHEPPSKFWMLANGRVSKEHHGFGMAAENHEQYEVMFATGLTDAEGNEIWEGDFIRRRGRTIEVKYSEVRVAFVFGNELYENLRGWGWTVIGNRYENSEILQEIG